MQRHISPNLMKKQTHPVLGCPEFEYIFSTFSLLSELSLKDSPVQAAGGMPMHIRYWKANMQARKKQYLDQTRAMAFLLR